MDFDAVALSSHDFAIASSLPSVTTRNLQVATGFVGNYAPYGLSPQIYDMPVTPKKGRILQMESTLIF